MSSVGDDAGYNPHLVVPVNEELERHLTVGERIHINIHQHPIVLWRPVGVALGVSLVMLLFLLGGRLPLVVLIAFLGAWAWVVWCEACRRHDSFTVTDSRILRVEGLINRSVPVMRHNKVTDLRLDRSLLGRLLGYGTITFESAGQHQSIQRQPYTPYPTEVYTTLNNALLGRKAREERDVRPGAAKRAAAKARTALERSRGRGGASYEGHGVAERIAGRITGRHTEQYPPPLPSAPPASPVTETRKPLPRGSEHDERTTDDTGEIPVVRRQPRSGP